MSITAVQSTQVLQSSTPAQNTPKAPTQAQEAPKSPSSLGTDSNKIIKLETGLVPTLKGAAAGLGGGLAAGSVPIGLSIAAARSTSGFGGLVYGILAASAIGGAVVSGTAAGAVAANTTDSKAQGALVGAGIGAVTGAAAGGAIFKNWTGVLLGAGMGALTGAGGGFAGSMVAKQQ